MKNLVNRILLLGVVLSLVALPSFAGKGEKPCEMETQECVSKMLSKLSGRGWVGIEMDRAEEGHWILTNVVPRSPAQKAGLKKGDELLSMNGLSFAEKTDALKKAHEGMQPGRVITYRVRRGVTESDVEVTLGKLPQALLAQWIGYHMLEGHSNGAYDKIVSKDP